MRRKRHRSFNIAPVIAVIIFLAAIAGITYFIFIKSTYINYGILLSQKDNIDSYDLKLGYDDQTKWVKVSKKICPVLPEGIAFNVRIRGITVIAIKPCPYYTGKVLQRSSGMIDLDNRTYLLDKNIKYYRITDGLLKKMYANDVIVGSSESKFIVSPTGNSNVIKAVIINPPVIKNIRVGISNYNFSSLNHYNILMHSFRGLIIKYSDGSSYKTKGEYLGIKYKGGGMEISVYDKNKDNITLRASLPKTSKRIFVYPVSDNPINIDSLKRTGSSYDYVPKYYGDLEFFIKGDAIRIVNEVDMESYLRFVVPSEMLSSGGIEGYKVQAVAARTYVLSDMLSGRFSANGFHVDDTTLSQVYNSQPSNPFCDTAVEATKGEVLTYNNRIIDAKYYSTSCGVGAPFNEVWYKGSGKGENIEPYLTFTNYSTINIGSLSDETTASNFLKDWTIKSYDSNSPYFRWKFTIDMKNLNTIINNNIYSAFTRSPDNFIKKVIFQYYKHVKIPKQGIGTISDLYISKRGVAGNVMEMTIVSDTGTYKISKDTNIKRLFVSKDIQITPLYGSSFNMPASMLSSFFVIDKESAGSSIKNVTIYGGGYGHGSGMSQYGVIGLVRQGKTYKDILNIYYKNVKINSYEYVLQNSF